MKIIPTQLVLCSLLLVGFGSATTLSQAQTISVEMQQATATHSQIEPGDYAVHKSIDGLKDDSGWAILPEITDQTATFETKSDLGFGEGSLLTFTLSCTYANQHTLGRFRFSLTTDPRDSFSDGAHSQGDVTANWIVCDPFHFSAANGTILTKLEDFSLLAGGESPMTEVYTVQVATRLTGISGVRLETLRHQSLPRGGPGRQPDNANFVLSEIEITAAPLNLLEAKILPATEICWDSMLNKRYSIFWASDTDSVSWLALTNSVVGTGAEICIFDSTRRSPKGYYRILEE